MKTIHTNLIIVVAALSCGSAAAQSIDYAALEALFGEPVTFGVTGSPQVASDVPASMVIISAEEIRRSGSRDLPEILRHVTGVDVLQMTKDHAEVSIRGYNQAFAPRLLVLLDGRQVYADYYGFTPWSAIPVEIEAIRQIEVVRGPNSALFGFNAVGGVVNIITYDPIHDDVSTASVSAGSQTLIEASAVSGWHFGDSAGLRMSVGHRENDDYSTPQRASDIGIRRGDERNSLHVDGAMRLTDKMSADFDASYSRAAQTELGPVYSASYTQYKTKSIKGRVAADTSFGLIEGALYTNWITGDIFPNITTTPFLQLDNKVTVAQFQTLSKVASDHTLRFSAEYRHNTLGTTPIGGADIFYHVLSVGGMWEWRINPAVTLTNAVRLDHLALGRDGFSPPGYPFTNADWDRSIAEASFNTGVVWHLESGDTLRFAIARGVQLPSLFNLGGFLLELPPAGYVTGIPTLAPTIVTNYDVTWTRAVPALGAVLRISVFQGTTRDLVANSGGSQPAARLVGTPANIGKSEARGLELSINGRIGDQWRWGANYAPISINDRLIPGFAVSNTFVDFEDTVPRHTLNANIGWTRGSWEVDGFLHYQSDSAGVDSPTLTTGTAFISPIDDYVSVDARVGFELNERITLAIAGRNLTQSEQRQTAYADVERSVVGTVSVGF